MKNLHEWRFKVIHKKVTIAKKLLFSGTKQEFHIETKIQFKMKDLTYSFYSRWNPEKSSLPKTTSEERKLTREEKRRRRRASIKYRTAHATRERMRVEAFNGAFGTLRHLLPTLPPDKKLSKIEILRLAICYINYLDNVLKPEMVDCNVEFK